MKAMLLLALVAGGCATVRQSDLDAWKGASTDELLTHRLWSTVPRSVAALSDGTELWDFANCAGGTTPVVCNKIGVSVICTGGQEYEACCHNQFFVRGQQVLSYRPVGRCYTTCAVRPASAGCAPDPSPAVATARLAR